MAATTGYQAGIETNDGSISYGLESAWGSKPAVQFQTIRYTSETLAQTSTRQRPTEITATREASQGVTTQTTAAGTINYALSYGTYDEFFACCLQDEWLAPTTVTEVGGDITLTVAGGPVCTLTSSLTNKFLAIQAGTWIRMAGFVATPANNGYWYVSSKTNQKTLVLTGPQAATAVTETPAGAAVTIKFSSITNGKTFRSMFVQKKFSSVLYQQFAGAYPSRMTVTGGLGNYTTGAIDLVPKSGAKATTDGSGVPGPLAATTGRVIDPIGGFIGIYWNGTLLGSGVDLFTITMENTGAASEFAMGSASAQGILTGTFTCSGSFRTYFKAFTEFDLAVAETAGQLAILVQDPAGNAYAFTYLSAILTTPRILAGGPGQAVFAEFGIEGGPSTAGTFNIDRIAA